MPAIYSLLMKKAGALLLVFGAVLWLIAIAVSTFARHAQGGWLGYAVGFLGMTLVGVVGVLSARLGANVYNKGRAQRNAGLNIPARDRRAPVLYLRSFADDAKTAVASDPTIFALSTEEEQMATVFGRIGPFVAFDRGPRLGAGGIPAGDNDWQEAVTEKMREAALVVLIHNPVEGVYSDGDFFG